MKKKIITLLIIALSQSSYSQIDCNCTETLEQLAIKIETEYPGFEDKTKNKVLYNSFKEKLMKRSAAISETGCIKLLNEYLNYFKDGHIYILKSNNSETTQNNKAYFNKKVGITLNEFYQILSNSTDELEGIWKSLNYKVGIFKAKNNEYYGFIIEADTSYWKPYEIKFKINWKRQC